jgi:hypothetical protein
VLQNIAASTALMGLHVCCQEWRGGKDWLLPWSLGCCWSGLAVVLSSSYCQAWCPSSEDAAGSCPAAAVPCRCCQACCPSAEDAAGCCPAVVPCRCCQACCPSAEGAVQVLSRRGVCLEKLQVAVQVLSRRGESEGPAVQPLKMTCAAAWGEEKCCCAGFWEELLPSLGREGMGQQK